MSEPGQTGYAAPQWQRPHRNVLGWPYAWQTPAVTEGHAYARICANPPEASETVYIGFPWATLIDLLNADQMRKAIPFLEALREMPVVSAQRRLTVAQHYWTRRSAPLFFQAGITDLFWTHATLRDTHLGPMRIHPFPLYPVQCVGVADQLHYRPSPPRERRYLYSFVGLAEHSTYRTPVRRWIAELPPRPDACILTRGEWHYQQLVYADQIYGVAVEESVRRQRDEDAAAYRTVIGDSIFSLCPAGAGPNSIRLWESLGYGSIPVILADELRLPGDRQAWQEAAVFGEETAASVRGLPAQLEALAQDPSELLRRQDAGQLLWRRYGPSSFTYDLVR